MHFLADVYVPCEVCKGARYNRETLEVQYKGKNISQVLNMTAEEAVEFFENLPKIRRKAQTLVEVGLGYVKLGQSSTTLSGGEAQRVKLATELARVATGRTIYVLDEPTTGLDPNQLVEIRNLIQDFGKDRTVLFSTHIMQEVTAICDRFMVLRKGELVADRAIDGMTGEQLETLFRELTA
jgi:excinuclease ABC subunit A